MDETRTAEARKTAFNRVEREAILQQLERILASPLFRHSRRYPNLLRHIVQLTLDGRTGELKERTVGCELFGREPDYETNADPIVRATAGEVRKRIAQYYFEPGHENELRIDLSPGSYIPEFSFPPFHTATETAPANPAEPSAGAAPKAPRRVPRHWFPAVTAILALAAAAAAWYVWRPRCILDQFWGPVLGCSNTVRVCVGQRHFLGAVQEPDQQFNPDVGRIVNSPLTLYKLYYLGSENVALPDAITVSRLTGLLQSRGKSYHVQAESYTTLENLRDGPVVLVGAFNNDWTLRLTGPLRFGFQRDGDLFYISDREHPGNRSRGVNYATPYLQLTRDYALISRVVTPTTERLVIVAAGLTGSGTTAAGELLTNQSYMEAVLKDAPRNWQRKNLQLVISTEVINGVSGPPHLVDQCFW